MGGGGGLGRHLLDIICICKHCPIFMQVITPSQNDGTPCVYVYYLSQAMNKTKAHKIMFFQNVHFDR